jgi:prepilin peptidase CpaA
MVAAEGSWPEGIFRLHLTTSQLACILRLGLSSTMTLSISLALLPLLAIAALFDLRQQRIPNWIAAIAGVLGTAALAMNDPGALWLHVLVALLVLIAGIIIWSCGWLGGGDVKLLAALSLWAGPSHVDSLLFATALFGGLLALAMVLARRASASPLAMLPLLYIGQLLTSRSPAMLAHSPRPPDALPYGLAVACGGCWLVHLLLA